MSEWISAEDRLPTPMVWVLVWIKNNKIDIAFYDNYSWTLAFGYTKLIGHRTITHWMPLPEPPEVN